MSKGDGDKCKKVETRAKESPAGSLPGYMPHGLNSDVIKSEECGLYWGQGEGTS